jgi:TIR domain
MATFISYSFQDQHKFDDICYALEQAGVKYWRTEEIVAGRSLRDELQAAIRKCSVCVFIATPRSLESAWCQAEVGAFWGIGRPVVVYLADEAVSADKLPKQFQGDK